MSTGTVDSNSNHTKIDATTGSHPMTSTPRTREKDTKPISKLLKSKPWLAPTATIILAIILWEVVVRLFDIPGFLLPPPSAVAVSLWQNSGLLLDHTIVTLSSTLIGFVASAVVGIALAVVMIMWPTVGAALLPIVVASQVIPKVAIAPLMVVWIGTGMTTAALIAFVTAFFPVVINATLGMKSVEKSSIDLLKSMRATKWQIFGYLRFPNALPYIVSGLQLAVAFAIVGTIVGEFVGSNSGLGYMLIVAQGNLRTDLLFAALVVLTVLGLVLYYGVEMIGRKLLRNRQ